MKTFSVVLSCTRVLLQYFLNLTESNTQNSASNTPTIEVNNGQNNSLEALQEALALYDADKTGRTDYALESAGGSIHSINNCHAYRIDKGLFSWLFYPIMPLCPMNDARMTIKPGVLPGECYAFHGDKCSYVIKLLGKVIVDSVTVEHLQKSISPTGELISAPKQFLITGLQDPYEKGSTRELLRFEYSITKSSLQTFNVTNSVHEGFNFVEVAILSNHGNPTYTCVYRVRIHGKLVEPT